MIFTFTAVQNSGPNLYFSHNLELHELRNLLHMMRWGNPGRQDSPDPAKNGELYGFPNYKGSPDASHPEWQYTARTLSVKYMTHIGKDPIRTGPSYMFQFSYSEGRAEMENGRPGIVKPVSNGTGKSASIMLPIYGDAKNPPSAMYLVEQAYAYLQARENCKLVRMGQTIDTLRYYAQSDPAAKMKYDALYSFERKGQPQGPPMTQQQAQDGYNNLANQQQQYDQYATTEHYEQAPAYQQAPAYDPNQAPPVSPS